MRLEVKCRELVQSAGTMSRVRECGKPVKGLLKSGKPACGVHLRAANLAAAATEKWKTENAKGDAYKDEVIALGDELGVRLFTVFVNGRYNTERVSISIEDLRRLKGGAS